MSTSANLTILGNVKEIIEGSPSSTANIPTSAFQFGLGAATHTEQKNFGEAIVWNHHCYHTSPVEELCYQEISDSFSSPFFMGIKGLKKPPKGLRFSSSPSMSLHSLYEQLAKPQKIGYILLGLFEFARLEGVYLKKPPIYQENILDGNVDHYLQHSPIFYNQLAYTFGAIISKKSKEALNRKGQILRGFYQSPKEKKSSILSHTHVVLIEGPSPSHFTTDFTKAINTFKPSRCKEAYHLLPKSEILRGVYFLIEIEEIETL